MCSLSAHGIADLILRPPPSPSRAPNQFPSRIPPLPIPNQPPHPSSSHVTPPLWQSVESHAREQATALSLLRARLSAAEADRAEWRRRWEERAGEEAAMAEQLRAALEQRTALMQASLQVRNKPTQVAREREVQGGSWA